jgi:hypothetical protein
VSCTRLDFVQLERTRYIIFIPIGRWTFRGQPTQSGILTVGNGFAQFDSGPRPQQREVVHRPSSASTLWTAINENHLYRELASRSWERLTELVLLREGQLRDQIESGSRRENVVEMAEDVATECVLQFADGVADSQTNDLSSYQPVVRDFTASVIGAVRQAIGTAAIFQTEPLLSWR